MKRATSEITDGVEVITGVYSGDQAFETFMVDDMVGPGWIKVDGAWQPPPPSAGAQLADARVQMAGIFDALSTDEQASFWTARVAVESALDRGRVDLARRLVELVEVPEGLAPVKASLLALFPQ